MADADHSELPTRVALSVIRTWRTLGFEQRLAAVGALLLIVSTFGPFSFVEGAVLLTAVAVLILLHARASGRAFHVPFGDGAMIAAAGAWSALLILIRLFNRPLGQGLLALVCATILIVAGVRERSRRPPDDVAAADAGAPPEAGVVRPARPPRPAVPQAGEPARSDAEAPDRGAAAAPGGPERLASEPSAEGPPAADGDETVEMPGGPVRDPIVDGDDTEAVVARRSQDDDTDPLPRAGPDLARAADDLTESLGEPPEFVPPTRTSRWRTRRNRRR